MPQAEIVIYFYMQMIRLLFQHKDHLEQVKEELTKNFSTICDWFVDNKLSIHFREDKTKSILLSFSLPKTEKGKYLPVSE